MRAASSPVRATSFSVRRRAARGFGRVAHFAHIKPWHVSVTGKERLPACSERCKGSPSLHADGTETAFWTRPEDLSFLGTASQSCDVFRATCANFIPLHSHERSRWG